MLNCKVISIHLFGNGEKKTNSKIYIVLQDDAENVMYRSHNQQGSFNKNNKNNDHYNNNNSQLDFLGCRRNKEGLENLIHKEHIKFQTEGGKQRATYLSRLCVE